ncbi:MAG: hypothetical protein AB2448_01815 [Moorella sp. (in: firmicutes)]
MFRKDSYYCDHCGAWLAGEVTYGTDKLDLCKECFEKEFTYCSSCHDVIRQEEAQYIQDQPYCSMCSRRKP